MTTFTPHLLRLPFPDAKPGINKAFFLYLPQGYDPDDAQRWPVMLFLHGDGERGDALDDLDYLLVLGPLYEAWIQKRDLPFIIIAPQLGLFGRDKDGPDYLTKRTRASIPPRLEQGTPPHHLDARVRDFAGPMTGALDPGIVEPPRDEIKDKMWDQADPEVMHILDFVLSQYSADPQRVYLTGVSLGGYGTWHFASRYPEKFAAILPVVGYGTIEQAEIIARAGIPVWAFSGGRDMAVQTQYFFPAMNKLDELGADYRFTTEQDMGHDVWNRTYAREDIYQWLLQYQKMPPPFVPDDFVIPEVLETPHFRLRMLSTADVEKDYDAVMSSRDRLRSVFSAQNSWPAEDMTLEQNLKDLTWHQEEFLARKSFTYTVVTPDESECLGCVYIYPSRRPQYDAIVFAWVRTSAWEKGLDTVLFNEIKRWLKEQWPFQQVAFPGREIGWDEWEATRPG